ncbi:unnamed protein product, partial [marine sediment metagenome]
VEYYKVKDALEWSRIIKGGKGEGKCSITSHIVIIS